MNTTETTDSGRLRDLVKAVGLSQPAALTLFNSGFGIRGLKEFTCKGYFCDASTSRFLTVNGALLGHAEKVFGPLQKEHA